MGLTTTYCDQQLASMDPSAPNGRQQGVLGRSILSPLQLSLLISSDWDRAVHLTLGLATNTAALPHTVRTAATTEHGEDPPKTTPDAEPSPPATKVSAALAPVAPSIPPVLILRDGSPRVHPAARASANAAIEWPPKVDPLFNLPPPATAMQRILPSPHSDKWARSVFFADDVHWKIEGEQWVVCKQGLLTGVFGPAPRETFLPLIAPWTIFEDDVGKRRWELSLEAYDTLEEAYYAFNTAQTAGEAFVPLRPPVRELDVSLRITGPVAWLLDDGTLEHTGLYSVRPPQPPGSTLRAFSNMNEAQSVWIAEYVAGYLVDWRWKYV